MITVSIGNADRELRSRNDIDESWINREINGRRVAGMKPCVRVAIKHTECDMILTTPGCSTSLGGGRTPNSCEREILEFWTKRGMNTADFTGGNLVAFLKQLFSRN